MVASEVTYLDLSFSSQNGSVDTRQSPCIPSQLRLGIGLIHVSLVILSL